MTIRQLPLKLRREDILHRERSGCKLSFCETHDCVSRQPSLNISCKNHDGTIIVQPLSVLDRKKNKGYFYR
jgi:hypothetical protein